MRVAGGNITSCCLDLTMDLRKPPSPVKLICLFDQSFFSCTCLALLPFLTVVAGVCLKQTRQRSSKQPHSKACCHREGRDTIITYLKTFIHVALVCTNLKKLHEE